MIIREISEYKALFLIFMLNIIIMKDEMSLY